MDLSAALDLLDKCGKWAGRILGYHHVLRIRRVAESERSDYDRLIRETQELLEGFNRLPEESYAYHVPFHLFGAEEEHRVFIERFLHYLDSLIRVVKHYAWSEQEIAKLPLVARRLRDERASGSVCREGLVTQENALKLARSRGWLSQWSRLKLVADKEANEEGMRPPT
jgi:hypothetical protein